MALRKTRRGLLRAIREAPVAEFSSDDPTAAVLRRLEVIAAVVRVSAIEGDAALYEAFAEPAAP